MALKEYDILTPDRETDEERRLRLMYEKWYDKAGNKKCQSCREWKNAEKEFSSKKDMWDGKQPTCKECAGAVMLGRRLAKKDDFELADVFRTASNTRIAIINEMINRSMTDHYN